jgi:hypothetical protein
MAFFPSSVCTAPRQFAYRRPALARAAPLLPQDAARSRYNTTGNRSRLTHKRPGLRSALRSNGGMFDTGAGYLSYKHPCARHRYRLRSAIDSYPSTAELFSGSYGSTATAEGIENEIAGIAARLYDAL